jgi:hexosaminidase
MMKKSKLNINYLSIIIGFVLLSACQTKSDKVYTEADIQIIPKVETLQLKSGVFNFNEATKFVVSNESQKPAAQLLINKFKSAAQLELSVSDQSTEKNAVIFKVDTGLDSEYYILDVAEKQITISASDNSGFLYAVQSLRQLLPTAIESKTFVPNVNWQVPNLKIQDGPRFKWRGLMLDLSRHFFDKNYLKETIDALSLLKMNVLHLHLVDDQGWRIEIKKYPKLTDIGAWRVDQEGKPWNSRTLNSPDEKGTYGGFLTQKELKEVVAYAELKGVEVIPEIEMPAHVSSAIAAYPELACFDNPKQIAVPSGALWPITDIYCAGKEHTFEFLEDVLTEVMTVFPSKYIHIGGDEATKTHWKACPYCQKRIKDEHLENVEELQSYFIKRIEKFINSKGKKLIGWDEILEGGLAPDATVMSWRGFKGGLEAAAQGHDVVMTPVSHSYFDYYQGPPELEPVAGGSVTTVSKVYQFDPVVESMTVEEAKHVLGGQANLWAEHVPTESHSQYMIFPRLTALAETVWSPKSLINWEDFSKRLPSAFERYEYLGINYAKSSFIVTSEMETNLDSKTVSLILHNEYVESDIRYALNNEPLNSASKHYTSPIVLDTTTVVKASLFKNDSLVGYVFKDTIAFHEAVAHKVDYKTIYHDRYTGSGAFNLTNTLRGTKNFRDGRWQAWLNTPLEVVIDLEIEKPISQVILGSMENQKNGIYYPNFIEVLVSKDGINFESVGSIKNTFALDEEPKLKDFKLGFESQNTRFIKVKASIAQNTENTKERWLFVDEVLVD